MLIGGPTHADLSCFRPAFTSAGKSSAKITLEFIEVQEQAKARQKPAVSAEKHRFYLRRD
ncbi:hypothetical protein [Sinorhizobium americanum]|uniref:Uncharacterized protein n=1 Tax=Sinorhizobium americanum TaxID=194963 RepID=A0A1L3LT00_9HYPH|nr:hypothetical protein [Sinorhizobium americanum]APG93219.1 hypothetical protein SAMCFNEI73_pB0019 [Sinorhizobium americanum]OAP48874.1 hypothetical protein ATC00_12660 [Sinorhizobium americanum]